MRPLGSFFEKMKVVLMTTMMVVMMALVTKAEWEDSTKATTTPDFVSPYTMHLPETIRVEKNGGVCFKAVNRTTSHDDEWAGAVCVFPNQCSGCHNVCWNAGWNYFCCDGEWCCCYASGGSCNRNPHCYWNACG